MPLSIHVAADADSATVSLAGEITVKTYRQITDVTQALADKLPVPKRVRLDMQQVTYIDSVGLGSLIKIHSLLGKAGADPSLTNLAPAIRDSLTLTKIDQIWKVE